MRKPSDKLNFTAGKSLDEGSGKVRGGGMVFWSAKSSGIRKVEQLRSWHGAGLSQEGGKSQPTVASGRGYSRTLVSLPVSDAPGLCEEAQMAASRSTMEKQVGGRFPDPNLRSCDGTQSSLYSGDGTLNHSDVAVDEAGLTEGSFGSVALSCQVAGGAHIVAALDDPGQHRRPSLAGQTRGKEATLPARSRRKKTTPQTCDVNPPLPRSSSRVGHCRREGGELCNSSGEIEVKPLPSNVGSGIVSPQGESLGASSTLCSRLQGCFDLHASDGMDVEKCGFMTETGLPQLATKGDSGRPPDDVSPAPAQNSTIRKAESSSRGGRAGSQRVRRRQRGGGGQDNTSVCRSHEKLNHLDMSIVATSQSESQTPKTDEVLATTETTARTETGFEGQSCLPGNHGICSPDGGPGGKVSQGLLWGGPSGSDTVSCIPDAKGATGTAEHCDATIVQFDGGGQIKMDLEGASGDVEKSEEKARCDEKKNSSASHFRAESDQGQFAKKERGGVLPHNLPFAEVPSSPGHHDEDPDYEVCSDDGLEDGTEEVNDTDSVGEVKLGMLIATSRSNHSNSSPSKGRTTGQSRRSRITGERRVVLEALRSYSKRLPSIPGIVYDSSYNRWSARWYCCERQQRRSKTFSVNKFGFTDAYLWAVRMRLKMVDPALHGKMLSECVAEIDRAEAENGPLFGVDGVSSGGRTSPEGPSDASSAPTADMATDSGDEENADQSEGHDSEAIKSGQDEGREAGSCPVAAGEGMSFSAFEKRIRQLLPIDHPFCAKGQLLTSV